MPRAAIYARISSDRDGDQLGVRRQLEDCEAVAARRGWEVAGRYVDDDVSAYSGRVRPEYRRMLEDLTAGIVDAVVVWDLDRLHRRPKELEEFFELCESAGITSLASVSGDVDLAPRRPVHGAHPRSRGAQGERRQVRALSRVLGSTPWRAGPKTEATP